MFFQIRVFTLMFLASTIFGNRCNGVLHAPTGVWTNLWGEDCLIWGFTGPFTCGVFYRLHWKCCALFLQLYSRDAWSNNNLLLWQLRAGHLSLELGELDKLLFNIMKGAWLLNNESSLLWRQFLWKNHNINEQQYIYSIW